MKADSLPQERTSRLARVQGREKWRRRALEAHDLSAKLGRLPRLSDDCDPALISWIKNQRRANNLDIEQCETLESLPGWSWAPHDDLWDARAGDLARFILVEQRLPRVRARGEDERALAHWLTRQRRSARLGALAYIRVVSLAAVIETVGDP